MKDFSQPGAQFYARGGSRRFSDTLVVAFVAHADDAEIMCPSFLAESWVDPAQNFGVVVLNDGVGRPRAPAYECYSDPDMAALRVREQFAAARAGKYEFALALVHPSSSTKAQRNETVVDELCRVLEESKPETVVTHNPWDVHPSHIAILQHTLWAIAQSTHKPKMLFGGEVWGPLDRVPEPYLVRWDCSGHEERLEQLLTYFASQNAIKSYDKAVMARRRMLAKLNDPHVTLQSTSLHLGVNLTTVLNGQHTLRGFIEMCDAKELAERQARFFLL